MLQHELSGAFNLTVGFIVVCCLSLDQILLPKILRPFLRLCLTQDKIKSFLFQVQFTHTLI